MMRPSDADTTPKPLLPSLKTTASGASDCTEDTASHDVVTVPKLSVLTVILSPSFFTMRPETRSPFFITSTSALVQVATRNTTDKGRGMNMKIYREVALR